MNTAGCGVAWRPPAVVISSVGRLLLRPSAVS